MTQIMTPDRAHLWQDPRAIALLLAGTMTIMANATISPALSGLEASFAGQPDAAMLTRLLVPAPSLAVVICGPLAGLAADRFGRRWQLLLGVVLFAVAGTAGLILPDLRSIFVSRLALGVAVAMIMTAQSALIADYYAGDRRSAFMGLQVAAVNFGGLVFITAAGPLAEVSPRLPFALYAVPALYLPVMWVAIKEARLSHEAPPEAAAKDGGHPRWPLIIGALTLLHVVTVLIFFMMPTQLPFFVETMGHSSAVTTSKALGALTLAGVVAALFYNRVQRAGGASGTFALGFLCMGVGFGILPFGGSLWAVIAGAAAIGAGLGVVRPNFITLTLNAAPAHRRGLASGVMTTGLFLAQFLSPFISQPSINAFGYGAVFTRAMIILLVLAIGSAVALGLHRRGKAP